MANPGLNVQVWQSLMAEDAVSLRADAAKAEHPSVADMVRLRKLGFPTRTRWCIRGWRAQRRIRLANCAARASRSSWRGGS